MRRSVRQVITNFDVDWLNPAIDRRAEGCHQITPEELERLQPLLDWLSPLHRDIFMFIWVAGFSQSQTARILGIEQPNVWHHIKVIPGYLDRIQQRFELMPKFLWWLNNRQSRYTFRAVEAFVMYFYIGATEPRGLTTDTALANHLWDLQRQMKRKRDLIGLKLFSEVYGQKLRRGDCNPDAVIPEVVARVKRYVETYTTNRKNKQNSPADGQKEIFPA